MISDFVEYYGFLNFADEEIQCAQQEDPAFTQLSRKYSYLAVLMENINKQ